MVKRRPDPDAFRQYRDRIYDHHAVACCFRGTGAEIHRHSENGNSRYAGCTAFVFIRSDFPSDYYIFDHLAALALKLIGIQPAHDSDLVHSEEEIKLIAGASQRGGIIDKTESEIIKNAVDFSDKIAREIMVPRQDMECLYLENTYEENFDIVKQSNHTRYPVCDEDKDNIVGMIHLRDILMNEDEKDITKMLREVLFVPESLSVSEVLHTMKRRRIHMAIVIDEYGGTSGLISMEDVLEELVGDIQDEHDTADDVYEKRLEDGSFEFWV